MDFILKLTQNLNKEFAGVGLNYVAASVLILLLTLVVRRVVLRKIISFFEKAASRTNATWDTELVSISRKPISAFILVLGIWIAVSVLPIPAKPVNIHRFVDLAARISLILIFTVYFFGAMNAFTKFLKEKAEDPRHWMDTGLVPLISMMLKVFVVMVIFVLIMQNLGYSVSALVASLGIGGIAVALAAQGTLANFFGSLMIMIDRPFRIGDWIKTEGGAYEGTVEEIGFRSTKIRTFEKTVQIIPNDKLAGMALENMDRRSDAQYNIRRVKMTIGLEYKTKPEEIEHAVDAIKNLLTSHPAVDQRDIFVSFEGFGDSSLNIFVLYYVNSTVWPDWLSTRHQINIGIMKAVNRLGLSFAFPSRSIYIEKVPEGFAPVRDKDKV